MSAGQSESMPLEGREKDLGYPQEPGVEEEIAPPPPPPPPPPQCVTVSPCLPISTPLNDIRCCAFASVYNPRHMRSDSRYSTATADEGRRSNSVLERSHLPLASACAAAAADPSVLGRTGTCTSHEQQPFHLVTGGKHGTVEVRNVFSGLPDLQAVPEKGSHGARSTSGYEIGKKLGSFVSCMCYTPIGHLWCGYSDGAVRVYDLSAGPVEDSLPGLRQPMGYISDDHDGPSRLLFESKKHQATVNSIVHSCLEGFPGPRGGGLCGEAPHLVHKTSGSLGFRLPSPSTAGTCSSLDNDPDEGRRAVEVIPYVYTCGADWKIVKWTLTPPFAPLGTVGSHRLSVRCLCATPSLLVSGGDDHAIRLWPYNPPLEEEDEENRTTTSSFEGHVGPVTCLLYHQGLLWSGSEDGTLRIWTIDESNRRCEQFLVEHQSPIVSIRPVDSTVYTCDKEGLIIVWEPLVVDSTGRGSYRSYEMIHAFRHHELSSAVAVPHTTASSNTRNSALAVLNKATSPKPRDMDTSTTRRKPRSRSRSIGSSGGGTAPFGGFSPLKAPRESSSAASSFYIHDVRIVADVRGAIAWFLTTDGVRLAFLPFKPIDEDREGLLRSGFLDSPTTASSVESPSFAVCEELAERVALLEQSEQKQSREFLQLQEEFIVFSSLSELAMQQVLALAELYELYFQRKNKISSQSIAAARVALQKAAEGERLKKLEELERHNRELDEKLGEKNRLLGQRSTTTTSRSTPPSGPTAPSTPVFSTQKAEELAKLKLEKNKLTMDLKQSRQEHRALKESNAKNTSSLSHKDAELSKLKAAHTKLTAEFERVSVEAKGLKNTSAKSATALEAKERELSKLNVTHKKLANELERSQHESKGLKESLSQKEGQLAELRVRHIKLIGEMEHHSKHHTASSSAAEGDQQRTANTSDEEEKGEPHQDEVESCTAAFVADQFEELQSLRLELDHAKSALLETQTKTDEQITRLEQQGAELRAKELAEARETDDLRERLREAEERDQEIREELWDKESKIEELLQQVHDSEPQTKAPEVHESTKDGSTRSDNQGSPSLPRTLLSKEELLRQLNPLDVASGDALVSSAIVSWLEAYGSDTEIVAANSSTPDGDDEAEGDGEARPATALFALGQMWKEASEQQTMLAEKYSTQTTELNAIGEQLSVANHRCDALHQCSKSLARTVADTQSALAEGEQTCRSLQQEREQLTCQVTELTDSREIAHNEAAGVQQQLLQLREESHRAELESTSVLSEKDQRISALGAEVATLGAEVVSLGGEVVTIGGEVVALGGELAARERTIDELKETCLLKDTEFGQLAKEHAATMNQLNSLEHCSKSMARALAESQCALLAHKEEAAEGRSLLVAHCDALHQCSKSLARTVADTQSALAEGEQTCRSLQQEREQLTCQVTELTDSREILRSEAAGVQQQLLQLREESHRAELESTYVLSEKDHCIQLLRDELAVQERTIAESAEKSAVERERVRRLQGAVVALREKIESGELSHLQASPPPTPTPTPPAVKVSVEDDPRYKALQKELDSKDTTVRQLQRSLAQERTARKGLEERLSNAEIRKSPSPNIAPASETPTPTTARTISVEDDPRFKALEKELDSKEATVRQLQQSLAEARKSPSPPPPDDGSSDMLRSAEAAFVPTPQPKIDAPLPVAHQWSQCSTMDQDLSSIQALTRELGLRLTSEGAPDLDEDVPYDTSGGPRGSPEGGVGDSPQRRAVGETTPPPRPSWHQSSSGELFELLSFAGVANAQEISQLILQVNAEPSSSETDTGAGRIEPPTNETTGILPWSSPPASRSGRQLNPADRELAYLLGVRDKLRKLEKALDNATCPALRDGALVEIYQLHTALQRRHQRQIGFNDVGQGGRRTRGPEPPLVALEVSHGDHHMPRRTDGTQLAATYNLVAEALDSLREVREREAQTQNGAALVEKENITAVPPPCEEETYQQGVVMTSSHDAARDGSSAGAGRYRSTSPPDVPIQWLRAAPPPTVRQRHRHPPGGPPPRNPRSPSPSPYHHHPHHHATSTIPPQSTDTGSSRRGSCITGGRPGSPRTNSSRHQGARGRTRRAVKKEEDTVPAVSLDHFYME